MFAGYHYDLNFLTIHGRSRFPGLNIWLRNGQKVEVKVPVGCLLIQTGKEVSVYADFLFIVLTRKLGGSLLHILHSMMLQF